MVLNPGAGSFIWRDTTGQSDPNKDLRVFYYRPEVVTADTPVWTIMHGTGRDASDYRDRFITEAQAQGAIVIAPEFNDADWPGSRSYNLGNIATDDVAGATPRPKQEWSFSKIEPLFDYVKSQEPTLQTNEYYMFGHSAGAQFVHRFLAWEPNNRVKLAVSANAGWYTVPDTNGTYGVDWPYSISNTPDYNPATAAYDPLPTSNLTNYLSNEKLVVLLGDEDLLRTSNLRQTPQADAQGLNRFERGQFFFNEAKAEAAALGVNLSWELGVVPGIGHSSSDMAIAAAELFRQANLTPTAPPINPDPNWYFTIRDTATLNGQTIRNEDIVQVDANGNFTQYFDGSDVGLGSLAIDAFDIISPTEILISLNNPGNIAGIGAVDDSDIIKFTATSLGANTAGTFEMYFDGSDVRLTENTQDIDAFTQLADGSLLISTTGGNTVPGINGADEDLLRFVPTITGNFTSGTWTQYFDGSDVGLGRQDIDGVSVGSDGKIYLSSHREFTAGGTAIARSDVFTFTATSTGVNTAGTIDPNLFFDGSLSGLSANDIKGIDLTKFNQVTQPIPDRSSNAKLYFALNQTVQKDGLTLGPEDIISFENGNFTRYFDGSIFGLTGLEIDAFDIISDSQILLSFSASTNIAGVGTVDDSDLVLFTATTPGDNTAGTFELYFDGSDVGLTTSNEDVDSVTLLQDGRLLISTSSTATVGNLTLQDEDIAVFTPTSLGTTTAGTWDIYFDGSDVGLGDSGEDIVGVSLNNTGDLYLSTINNFSAQSAIGGDEDVFKFTTITSGANTQGTIDPLLYFDGSSYGIGGPDIRALDLQVGITSVLP